MPNLRRATLADAPTITLHRHAMFADNGFSTEARYTAMDAAFEPWLRKHLADGTYIGLLLEDGPTEDGTTKVLAGAGIYLMEFPPHFLHDEPLRAYLLNFYTAPAARGCGYAKQLLQAAVDESHAQGATIVTLHASQFGRPIYEKFGFKATTEMMLAR